MRSGLISTHHHKIALLRHSQCEDHGHQKDLQSTPVPMFQQLAHLIMARNLISPMWLEEMKSDDDCYHHLRSSNLTGPIPTDLVIQLLCRVIKLR